MVAPSGSASPLCGSQIPLRVPSPSRNFLYFSKFILQPEPPRCSAGWHQGSHKLQPLSPAQHSRWTPLSRPLTTGSVSLFDEAHEKPPRAEATPLFANEPSNCPAAPGPPGIPYPTPSTLQLSEIVCPGDISSKGRELGRKKKKKNQWDLRLAGRGRGKTQAMGRWVTDTTLVTDTKRSHQKSAVKCWKRGPGEAQEQMGSRSLPSLPPDTRHMFTSPRLRGTRKAEKEIYWF